MAVFSVNQVRHLYVVDAVGTISDTSPIKTISVDDVGDYITFTYVGAGGITRTDLIKKGSITYSKAIKADKLARPLRKVTVSLDSNVNAGNPIAGLTYILGINIREFGGLSPESTYYKNVAVDARTGMTPTQFYKALEEALTKSFSRESIKYFTFTSTATELIIEEVEQPWRLGVKSSDPLVFDVMPSTVIDGNGFEVPWGVVAEAASTESIPNGKVTADLEYFCMGDRGDVYRGVGFPNTMPTTYLVDPSKAYDYIELQYHYKGEGNAVLESQKHLTIVVPTGTVTNDLITAINLAHKGENILSSI